MVRCIHEFLLTTIPTGYYFIVIIDEFSRFPVAEITKCLTAEKITPILDKVFSMFSYPRQIKTDNGPPSIVDNGLTFAHTTM